MRRSGEMHINKYVVRGNEEEEVRLSSVVPTDNTAKLKNKTTKLYLNIARHFFTLRVVKHWRLSRDVEIPSVMLLKTSLDIELDNRV